jgi:hypothetical protein
MPRIAKILFVMTCASVLSGVNWKVRAAERLGDGGLEASTPNGTFPSSGFWLPASAGAGASAICTTTAGKSGATSTNGLWTFTGDLGSEWWSGPYQQTSASSGTVFTASAWIRAPVGQPWVAGSKALLRVDFLNAASNVLASHESAPLTTPNTDWALFQVTTLPAPVGTVRAAYNCYVAKPNGTPGVSVANFDDCSLLDQNVLLNPDFQEVYDIPGLGPFPTNWTGGWLGESGAVSVTPSDLADRVLWQFTGSSTNDLWVAIHQYRPATNGEAFVASASVRTPPSQPWVNGSQAYFRVLFVNASNSVLASYQGAVFTTPNTNWSRFNLTTEAAPTNTASVRFTCYLVKPSNTVGQSIVNFDDCSLVPISLPGARVSSRALGLSVTQNQTSFELRNTGKAPLTWQILENIPWLSAPVASGTVAPLSASSVTVNVNRTGLGAGDAIKGTFTLQTNDKNIPIDVYVDRTAPAPPSLPAEVRFYGRQMRVRDRLPDGTLSAPYHYIIKGSGWSPASIGLTNSAEQRRAEFDKWYIADIQLHRAMNANTVYSFLDFGTNSMATRVLDNLYKNGLKAIVTVDQDGTGQSNNLAQVVTAYRNHPAILAWAIGNEWNINLYHQHFSNIGDAATATESLARQVKALDPNHPVAAIFGDIDIMGLNPLRKSDENVNQPFSTERIVNDICSSVDFWGLNIYRGNSFGNVFTQWASITAKPMFFSEFGTDAYRSIILDILDGQEDQPMQAAHNHGLWNEIVANLSALHLSGICAGGTAFEWNDEWWKARVDDGALVDVQENLGYGGGQSDNFANEEWFAVAAIDRRLRQTYFNFQADFAAATPAVDLDQDGIPDAWEYQVVDANGADSLGQISDVLPGDDFDGDTLNNSLEFVAQTDPASSNSAVALTRITRSNQSMQLQWIGPTNTTQYLERTTSLNPIVSWQKILTNTPPTPITNQFTDLNVVNQTNYFYRIRVTR